MREENRKHGRGSKGHGRGGMGMGKSGKHQRGKIEHSTKLQAATRLELECRALAKAIKSFPLPSISGSALRLDVPAKVDEHVPAAAGDPSGDGAPGAESSSKSGGTASSPEFIVVPPLCSRRKVVMGAFALAAVAGIALARACDPMPGPARDDAAADGCSPDARMCVSRAASSGRATEQETGCRG